ncbi:MAG: leucine--tRNA ligase [Patescibacteria group bacterium]|nr:leucine--tRNA ligase [Patescibacteria group bacterium]MCL5257692.1 leucine--tRNA ligase [Patescibacteria group bacterium]
MDYPFKKIERKWQSVWQKNNFSIWRAKDFGPKKKIYILDMFPYPSGEGLHVGHTEGETGSDILSRYSRMNDYNVLHPMGWDAFGLPAENYAIKMKKNPMTFISKNIATFKKQQRSIGLSFDWSREINTTDPNYYKWTQLIFLKLFEKGLAYKAEAPINFCPSCKTGLANEEVVEGKCERCGAETTIKNLNQWHLKITAYAERLLNDLDKLNWPENIKELQRNWIGRSEGYEIDFPIEFSDKKIRVFTTRADTIYGATFLVLAPEHNFCLKLAKDDYYFLVERYLKKTARQDKTETTGVFTGSHAIHPLTGDRLPIWISDYVLGGYGSAAIMAVPAHDKRDYVFAKKFSLPIKQVIQIPNEKGLPFENYGQLLNSEEFTDLSSKEAANQIGNYLKKIGLGKMTIKYRLRDWIFSRQRYWGEPIPLVNCPRCGIVPLKEKDLPLKLPKLKTYAPTGTGESPLKNAEAWVKTRCPRCHRPARRETDTMPNWAGSCWYYIRYIDPKNKKSLADKKKLKTWLPVDVYVGGVEHAVLHLLYARFWHKFLYDLKIVATDEPFQKLVNQGIVLGPDNQKMSKSKGNVVNPDSIVKKYGADSLRLFLMFMGPFEAIKSWDEKNINGVHRFLIRLHRFGQRLKARSDKTETKIAARKKTEALERLNWTTVKVSHDIETFNFNTAISASMEFLNYLEDNKIYSKKIFLDLVKLLFPFAPHLSQEIWSNLGKKTILDKEKWPKTKTKSAGPRKITLIVQFNGKKKTSLVVDADKEFDEIKNMVLAEPKVRTNLKNAVLIKTVYVKNAVVNFVVKPKTE